MANDDQIKSLDDPAVHSYVADVNADDPQSAAAVQGFNQLGQAAVQSQPVQNIITGQGLQNYQDNLNRAMAGDEAAQQQLAQHSAGIAMGSLGPAAPGAALEAGAVEAPALQYGPKAVRAQQQAARAADFAQRTQAQTKAVQAARQANAVPGVKQYYAEGGEIDSPEVSQFLGSGQDMSQLPQSGQPSALDSSEVNQYLAPEIQQAKYGTPSQQAIAGLEGVAKGVLGPVATGAELASGITSPEAIRGRSEANPVTSGLGEAVGFGGSALTGVGEAAALGHAAEAAGLGARAGSKFINQVGQDAIKGAFETALFQGGEEIHKAFVQDPNQSAETAIADIGLAGVMGGVFGGALGAGLRSMRPEAGELASGAGADIANGLEGTNPAFVSELDRAKLGAGDLGTIVKNSNTIKPSEKENILSGLDLGKMKKDAPEIIKAGKEIGAPPPLEGMLSDNHYVQKADNLLSSGVPTYSGVARHNLYKQQYAAVDAAVQDALGPGSEMSKAELGNTIKDSLTKSINEQYGPIKAMYDDVNPAIKANMLAKNAGEDLVSDLKSIPELRIAPSSEEGQLVRKVINDAPNLQTVNDVKIYKQTLNSILQSHSADPGKKRIASILVDKLNGVIDNSITDPLVKTSLKEANAAYKPFIKDIQTLSEQLGKGKVHGVQDALNFIQNRLTPEEITGKLFSKRDSEFLKFFESKYPEQMEMMRAYQKGAIREAASRTGTLSPKLVYGQVNKLEPEIQKSLFGDEALKKLKASETYLRSFPKDFNPSHTSDATAFRDMFSHGLMGAASANARDAAMELFIKSAGKMPEIQGAHELAKSTVNGWNVASRGVKAIFNPDKAMPSGIIASIPARDKLKKMVEDYSANPQKMLNMGANNPIPQYSTAFAATGARAVQYLNTLKPNMTKAAPLDSKPTPTADAIAKYHRALDLAQNPALILKSIKEGNVRPSDLATIQNIYPSYYKQLGQKLTNEMIETVNKGKVIPYKTKMALSMFMAQPLDSTMQPMAIQSAQSVFAPKQPPQGAPGQAPASKGVKSAPGLQKLPSMYQTQNQARQSRQNKD